MLLTKLHISPPGAQTVHRGELFEKLAAGLKAKLMLISAPAGFGKTTLVSDWIIQQQIPAAWYSIDHNDNDASEFLSYIIKAIQRIYPEFGESALKLLHSPKQVGLEPVVGLLINEILYFPKQVLLVLDDFHLIHSREVLNLLTYFIEHLPATIHLAILTRADPILPLAKLRSQQQLVELRLADLSFSDSEIDFLFNRKLKLRLSAADIQSLANKTEGWIAGLQLLALSLRDRLDSSAFIRDFNGDNRYIMDYLIEEVLKVQTAEIKEFLLKTSLLEQLSGPLCDAVLGRDDSQNVLEMLEQNNVFIVSLDTERKWYRYHHLFADLLRQRLLLKDQTAVLELHQKASSWFESNKMYPWAIEHVLQTHNYEQAIKLLVDVAESMWENGHHSSIMKYGDLLPLDIVAKNPRFSLFYAWVLLTAGQTTKAAPLLAVAEKIIHDKIGGMDTIANQEEKKLAGKIAVAIAYQHSLTGRPELILEYCHLAFDNLAEEDPLWFSWGWYAMGMAELASEKLFESTEALRKALIFGKKSGNIYLITTIATTLAFNEGRLGLYKLSYQRSIDLLDFLKENGYSDLVKTDWTFSVLYANMAAIRYFWADLESAAENIKIAYSLCITGTDMTSRVLVLIVYSVVLHGQGDLAAAEAKLQEAEAIIQKNKVNPFRESMYIGWKAIFLISKNELLKARDFLESHGVPTNKPLSYANEYRYIAYALLLMAERKMDDAYQMFSQLYKMASAQSRMERMIEIKIFFAIIQQATGEKQKALESLTESLKFAAEDEILMSHLNYLDKISPLLQEIFKDQAIGKIKLPNRFINKLKDSIEQRKKVATINFGFTTRERDALQLMSENLSNQEIADKLFISLNTVKTRLKSLYIKLDVDSRSKAVEKAKKIRLI